jgi:hypothetical protein
MKGHLDVLGVDFDGRVGAQASSRDVLLEHRVHSEDGEIERQLRPGADCMNQIYNSKITFYDFKNIFQPLQNILLQFQNTFKSEVTNCRKKIPAIFGYIFVHSSVINNFRILIHQN